VTNFQIDDQSKNSSIFIEDDVKIGADVNIKLTGSNHKIVIEGGDVIAGIESISGRQ